LVHTNLLGIAHRGAGLLKGGNHVIGPVAEPWIGEKRENVSITVSTLIFLPVANWSCTKSIA
jgi:hypothetical protein